MATSNQLEKYLTDAAQWVRENQERFWAITGAVLFAAIFLGLLIHHRETENEEAWTQLGGIQGQMMQGKTEDARKGLDGWQARFQASSAATYAKFMKADLLYRTTDYAQASQLYAEIAQTGRPTVLQPLALSAQIACEEMAGHIPQAQALVKTFLELYPDHFLSGSQYMSEARLAELAGNPAAAVAVYERFVLLYPQSPWTALARARMQALGSSGRGNAGAPLSSPQPLGMALPNGKP